MPENRASPANWMALENASIRTSSARSPAADEETCTKVTVAVAATKLTANPDMFLIRRISVHFARVVFSGSVNPFSLG